ncbi:hypothetical protein Vqi01_41640 [Micromonospora qiuiae]|uniref:Uncharacterized protein n=1 Tax=Micromonospora qiuiae TaxID=502268 RepID=A0ABQ4JHL7_9ACTN|nr:hypothetical protein Vqi01_41640 [Micromonospora qiuiae]
MKASVDALIRIAVPAGTALMQAPWWTVVGVFVLVLTHRILPWESKDLLTLWLRIIPDRRDKTDKDRSHERRNGRGRRRDQRR